MAGLKGRSTDVDSETASPERGRDTLIRLYENLADCFGWDGLRAVGYGTR